MRCAQPFLERLPQRAWLGERLKQLWTYERFGVPHREGGKYFYMRNDGTQDQSVLYVADALDATPRVLVDPNGKRDDATIALSQWEPSPDGKLLAYALSDGGTDWNTWHFRRVADGVGSAGDPQVQQVLAGLVGARQFRRLLQPLSAQAGPEGRRSRARRRCRPARRVLPQARRAAVGRSPRLPGHRSSDARAVRRRSPKTAAISSSACSTATRPNAVLVQDLRKPGAKPQPLFVAWDALYNFLGSNGDELYFQTTNAAPRGRVIAVDARDPRPRGGAPSCRTARSRIANASYVGGRVVVEYSRDARSVVRLFEVSGAPAGEVKLPGLGTAERLPGQRQESRKPSSPTRTICRRRA